MAVGQNVLRKEGYEKLTGAARYIDDISLDGMLYGKTFAARSLADESRQSPSIPITIGRG